VPFDLSLPLHTEFSKYVFLCSESDMVPTLFFPSETALTDPAPIGLCSPVASRGGDCVPVPTLVPVDMFWVLFDRQAAEILCTVFCRKKKCRSEEMKRRTFFILCPTPRTTT